MRLTNYEQNKLDAEFSRRESMSDHAEYGTFCDTCDRGLRKDQVTDGVCVYCEYAKRRRAKA